MLSSVALSRTLAFAPRAILFDLDDTLCDDANVWFTCSQKAARDVAMAVTFGGSLTFSAPDSLADVFLGISERYWFSWDAVRETRPLFKVRQAQWRQALAESGEEAQLTSSGASQRQLDIIAWELATVYGKCRSDEITLFPDVAPTLVALRGAGICLALITNGLATTHVEKVEQLGLESLFDHVVIAGIFGHFKPDRIIYDHALQLCGCDAAHALMVGDSLVNDVEGAQAAGVAAAWFNPKGLQRPDNAARPLAGELRAVGDLLNLLKIQGAEPPAT